MAIWSRKKCGPDFIDKVADGTVSFDILDLYDEAQLSGWYLTADQFSYKRDDGSATSATIQFVHNSEENATKSLGNAKKISSIFCCTVLIRLILETKKWKPAS